MFGGMGGMGGHTFVINEGMGGGASFGFGGPMGGCRRQRQRRPPVEKPSVIAPGTKVRIYDLKSKQEYNGSEGRKLLLFVIIRRYLIDLIY